MKTLLRDVGGTYVPRIIAPLFDSMQWRLPPSIAEGDPPTKVASITFDDGPTASGTRALLDVLSEFGVRATHFVIGENAEKHPELVAEIVDGGHELGNHSWSHSDAWQASMATTIREFQRTDALLASIAESSIRWVRPPFGKFTYPLIHWARRRKKRVVMWDTMPPDYSRRADTAYVSRVLSRLRRRSIVCLHDNDHSRKFTPAALRETLPRLIDDGWSFVPLASSE